jgi:hypothetical protein
MSSVVVESKLSSQKVEDCDDANMGQICQKSESVTVCTPVDTNTTAATINNPTSGTTIHPTSNNSDNDNINHKGHQDCNEPCPSPTSTVYSSSDQETEKGETQVRPEMSTGGEDSCSERIVDEQQVVVEQEEVTTTDIQISEKDHTVVSYDEDEQIALVETENQDQDCNSTTKNDHNRSECCTSSRIEDATASQGDECTLLSRTLENSQVVLVSEEETGVLENVTVKEDNISVRSIIVTDIPPPPPDLPPSSSKASSNSQSKPHTMHTMITQQQQALMMESGKLLEHLRKEVYKLRSQNSQLRSDFETLKGNNQRLMDANVSLGNTFDALNKHAKHVSKTNSKLKVDVQTLQEQIELERKQSKDRIDALELLVMELRDELNMKQETYIQEVHSRLHCQKVMTNIVDAVQERCKDHRLVEDILGMSDECGF